MTLSKIVKIASNKEKFLTLTDYIEFCKVYLEFAADRLQAVIVSKNENHYRFYQYKKDGHFNITRPINSNLMYGFNDVSKIEKGFFKILRSIRDIPADDKRNRELIRRGIYTVQQSIGAALDALPAGASNKARKVNGDLFERFIQLLINPKNAFQKVIPVE